jgi:hypothetical protein
MNNELSNLIRDEWDISPRGMLLHTFAHLLSKEITKECGYQLSSLKERIYSSSENNMHGVLIYTASSDSQGSLGGLIYQAQELSLLKEHIRSMLDNSYTCSQDPLCGLNDPSLSNEPWGASCHSCCHLPETSCEGFMNNFLDRYAVSSKRKGINGFFDSQGSVDQ